jgi:hypothetical protein
MNPQERTQHCREIHKYPKNYRYDEFINTKKVPQNDSSMEIEDNKSNKKKNVRIHFGKKSQKSFEKKKFNLKPAVDIKSDDTKTESNVSLKPATMFIPRQVQQKSYAQLLTKNQKLERNVLESESIMELCESLPST